MKQLIKCGKLFDGEQEKYFDNVSILVDDEKIISVGQLEIEPEYNVIDLSDKIVTPGLMDIHNHNIAYDDRNVYTILNEITTKNECYSMLGIVHHLNKLLEKGFTVIRDCCQVTDNWNILDVRDAIRDNIISGPDLLVCGHSGGAIGSHIDCRQFVSNRTTMNLLLSPSCGSGAEFFRRWVRTEVLHHVDFIKIHIDGGFLTPGDHPNQQTLTNEEIGAIVETAHMSGLKVSAHVYNDNSARNAINLGVDCIEHGALFSTETYDLMAEKHVNIVPTMTFFDRGYFLEPEELAKVPPFMAKKYRELHPQIVESRTALMHHIENDTIVVGYGTDFGATDPTLPAHREFETMIKSGIKPFKALKIATSNSAKIIGRENLGSIKAGMQADIVAWDKDPTKEIDALREAAFVMKKGKIVKFKDNIYKTF